MPNAIKYYLTQHSMYSNYVVCYLATFRAHYAIILKLIADANVFYKEKQQQQHSFGGDNLIASLLNWIIILIPTWDWNIIKLS